MPRSLIPLAAAIVVGAVCMPAQAAEPPVRAQITQRLRFAIVSGRIVAQRRLGPQIPVEVRDASETLEIKFIFGLPTMNYTLSKADEKLHVTVRDAVELVINQTHKGGPNPASFEFKQLTGEPITLSVTEGDQHRLARASTVWNLMLAEPEVSRKQLIPVLEMLRPDWNLASNVAALEDALFRRAGDQLPDRRRLARLVEQLGSPKFSERRQAERELRAAGQVVLPYLESLQRSRLDPEQWERVRGLIDALEDDREDRVDRMAVWLAGHEQTWLALLARDEEWKRRAAAVKLSSLLGESVDFDPAADAAVRRKQIVRLRDLFDKTASVPAKVQTDMPDDSDEEE